MGLADRSFVFNMILLSEEGLTGGTQLMAVTVSVSNMAFKLWKLRRNWLEVAELQLRQSPEALQDEVIRALQEKSFRKARVIMEDNPDVSFKLFGSPSGDLGSRIDYVISVPEAADLFLAVNAAAEVALRVKVGDGLASKECEIFKVAESAFPRGVQEAWQNRVVRMLWISNGIYDSRAASLYQTSCAYS